MAKANSKSPTLEDPRTDFRYLLQDELLKRCRKNSRYSMRSFARTLRLDSSALSKMLSGKRGISKRMLKRLGESLGMSPDELIHFRATHRNTKPGGKGVRQFETLPLDTFQFISSWYYYAILSLVSVKDFKPTPKWIARVLDITVSEVKIAIERLQRLGFLEVKEDGTWHVTKQGLTTVGGHEYTAPAFRRLQRQVLEKALEALETVPIEQRDQSSITMAIDSEMLPEAKARIKAFRREMSTLLQGSNKPDRVYHLGISLYPVSQNVGGKK